MIRKCEFEGCAVEFEGSPQSHYCPEHRLLLQREAHKRYADKTRDKKKKYQRDYYLRNREMLLAKQKAYSIGKKPNGERLEKANLTGWKIEYLRKGDSWTWQATKGNVTLVAHRNFYSLRTAQKDCMLAIG